MKRHLQKCRRKTEQVEVTNVLYFNPLELTLIQSLASIVFCPDKFACLMVFIKFPLSIYEDAFYFFFLKMLGYQFTFKQQC